MKLITRNTDYALRALCVIAKEKQIVSVAELTKELKVPQPFLRKLLQVLNRKKIVVSHKGQGGGFTLGKAPEKITLVELIEIFQGPLHINECFLKKAPCPRSRTCPLKKKIDAIEDYVIKELKSLNVAYLIKGV